MHTFFHSGIASLCTLQQYRKEAAEEAIFKKKGKIRRSLLSWAMDTYEHHARGERRGDHCNPYHSKVNPENHDLSNALDIVYGDSIGLGSKKAAVSSKEGVDRQRGDSDGVVVLICGSEKTSDSKESESKLSAFMLQAVNVPEHE